MERGTIRDGVRTVMKQHLAIDGIDEGTHLFEDLKLDSVQQLTLVVELENHFRICFDEADEANVATVGDVVELIARRLESS